MILVVIRLSLSKSKCKYNVCNDTGSVMLLITVTEDEAVTVRLN